MLDLPYFTKRKRVNNSIVGAADLQANLKSIFTTTQ